MSIEIKSPTFPESVADGTVANWLKKEGEPVNQDDVIAEIETDKVVLEVLAQSDGVITKIIKLEGEIVSSSEVIGEFSESSDMLISLAKHLASSPQGLTEDGHTDVPSAIRKLKTSMEDAMQILSALEQMPDTELPSWWMSKVTLAADYLNKSRDYLLVSEKLDPSDGAGSYVKDFRKSDAPQFKGKGKKKRQQMAIAAYLQDKEENK